MAPFQPRSRAVLVPHSAVNVPKILNSPAYKTDGMPGIGGLGGGRTGALVLSHWTPHRVLEPHRVIAARRPPGTRG